MSVVVRQRDADVGAPPSGPAGTVGSNGPHKDPSGPVHERGSARQRILDVASELFCSRGYERTPLRAVAESLGITKAAIYYHFKAKEDLLVAIVGPLLDRIDELIASAGPRLGTWDQRREFLAGYVDELSRHPGIVALLLRDPGVGEHPLGERFAAQHIHMRSLLGNGPEPASVIRTTTALRALELAVMEFGDAHPDHVRDTALAIAISAIESEPGS